MRLTDILSEERVTTQLAAVSKDEALRALARLFTQADPALEEGAVYDVLSERERLASTGIGSGVAIPHARLPDLQRPCGLLARLKASTSFRAVERRSAAS